MKLIGRGNITAVAGPTTQIVLDNCGLFTKYFTKNDGTTIYDAEYWIFRLDHPNVYFDIMQFILFWHYRYFVLSFRRWNN